MQLALSKEQQSDTLSSMRRFCAEQLDLDLSELQAGFLLEYFQKEIAPFAYNKGVEDARGYFVTAAEDLPGTCFEEALTYWTTRDKTSKIRRKPGA